jgi:hypothetical protein
MTDQRHVPSVKHQSKLDAGEIDALHALLQDGKDIDGLVTTDMVAPTDGIVESSTDTTLMERVALSIVNERIDKGEKADIYQALNKAGCTPQMYVQMVQHPDYKQIYDLFVDALIVWPRMPTIKKAITKEAEKGDVAAARLLKEGIEASDRSIQTMLEAYNKEGGGDSFMLELDKRIDTLKRMRSDMEKPEADPDVVKAEQGKVSSVTGKILRHKVDHNEWFEGDRKS